MASVPGRFLNQENIIKKVFDETTDSLRVNAKIGGVDVNLSAAAGDNVAISDGVDTLVINPDGSINVNAGNIIISHLDDSIRLGDGTNLVTTSTVGAKQGLDVNIVNVPPQAGNTTITFNAISSVPSATPTTIVTKTITSTSLLKKCTASGENISKFDVVLNGNVIASKRTYFGANLSVDFDFDRGIELVNTDILLIRAEHSRPMVANYEANIILVEGV